MAQDIPSKLPEWCSDPSGDTDTTGKTEPTSGQKAAGWQPAGSTAFPDGFPVRQIMNWLLHTIWTWLVWLKAATRRTTDLHDDGPLPGYGDAPTVAAGLGPVSAGDFAARAYVDGYEVGPVDSPAHTYTASKDTYWDLGRDGGWTAVEVNAGDPAPSVTADSVRVYKVTTDGSDRTAVVDYRPARIEVTKAAEFKESIRLGLNKLANAAAAAVVRLQVPYSSSYGYTFVAEFADADAAEGTTRVYLDGYGIPVMVRGASWDGTQWVTDSSPPLLLSRIEWRGSDGLRVRQLDASVHTPNFADSVWEEQPDADHARGLLVDGTLSIFNPATPSALYQAGTPKLFTEADETVAHRAWAGQLGTYFHVYSLLLATVGTDDGGGTQAKLGGELVSNATYNAATGQWDRQNAGGDSYKLELSSGGLRVLAHRSSEAASWDDIVNPGTDWTVVLGQDTGTRTIRIPASRAALSTKQVGSSPAVQNELQWQRIADIAAVDLCLVTCTTEDDASLSIDLAGIVPKGALITAVKVKTNTFGSSAGTDEVRVAVFRSDGLSSGDSFRSGTAYDAVTPHGSGTKAEFSLTLSASASIRTVDPSAYFYVFVMEALGTAKPDVEWIEVTYQVRA